MTIEANIGTREPARLPRRMSAEDEYLHLCELIRRAECRRSELSEVLGPLFAPVLPKSGLRIVSSTPGSALYKGGRLDG